MRKVSLTEVDSVKEVTNLNLSKEEIKRFQEQGYLGPYEIFEAGEAKIFFERCFSYPRLLLPWSKGRHEVVGELARLAMNPKIVKKAASLIGDDILLWGSMMIRQKAAGKHPIHVDLEHTFWDGLTVWIAMHNVVSGSSFSIIPGSHLFNTSPQELKETQNLDYNDEDAVLAAARKINPLSELLYLDITDGQFIIFSGQLWHGTKNTTSNIRGSIILQYTNPKSEVKIPRTYSVANNGWLKQKPQCVLVSGKDNYKVNKTVDLKTIDSKFNLLKGLVYHLPLNLAKNVKQKI